MNPYERDYFPIVLKLTKPHQCYPQVPRWKINSGDWTRFRELTQFAWNDVCAFSFDDAMAYLAALIIYAASAYIPLSRRSAWKRRIPRWKQECKEARRRKNKAWWCLLRDSPTAESLLRLKHIKWHGRWSRRIAKREKKEDEGESLEDYRPVRLESISSVFLDQNITPNFPWSTRI